MSVSMGYYAARDRIKSGDIVHVYAPDGWNGFQSIVHWIIRAVTGSPIFHNVIAMWMTTPSGERRLMAVESNIHGGKRIIPLSHYMSYKLEVQPLPADKNFLAMEPTLMKRVGEQKYGLMDFVNIGLWKLFHIKSKDFGGQVCSELCADAWTAAGVPGLTPSWRVSPADLRARLIAEGIEPSIMIDQ
jgi:hypothetical protein